MKRLLALLPVAVLAAAVPVSAFAASVSMPTHVVLRVTKQAKSRTAFKHVMASATLTYTKHDVTIKLTTDNLPKASTLGKRVYVVYASDGAMTEKVGVLKAHGAMAGLSAQVMMTKVHDLYVYAEGSANASRSNGIQVLSAMV